jgi:hypothetical protein
VQKTIETSSDHFRPNTCQACRRPVIWAKLGTKLIPVETCAAGAGNIGLCWGLFAKPNEAPTAELVATSSRYRSHREHCADRERSGAAGGAFSGPSFRRKKR